MAVIVKISPSTTHPSADILDAGLLGHVGKGAVAIIAIEVFASEIVHDIQVGPMVTVVIAPGAAETEACIVLIQARLPGYVVKCSVAVVAKQEIRRTILRVEIRHRIAVLIRSLIVGIKTEIDVQPAIP